MNNISIFVLSIHPHSSPFIHIYSHFSEFIKNVNQIKKKINSVCYTTRNLIPIHPQSPFIRHSLLYQIHTWSKVTRSKVTCLTKRPTMIDLTKIQTSHTHTTLLPRTLVFKLCQVKVCFHGNFCCSKLSKDVNMTVIIKGPCLDCTLSVTLRMIKSH